VKKNCQWFSRTSARVWDVP